jgi:hypothetical protein
MILRVSVFYFYFYSACTRWANCLRYVCVVRVYSYVPPPLVIPAAQNNHKAIISEMMVTLWLFWALTLR